MTGKSIDGGDSTSTDDDGDRGDVHLTVEVSSLLLLTGH